MAKYTLQGNLKLVHRAPVAAIHRPALRRRCDEIAHKVRDEKKGTERLQIPRSRGVCADCGCCRLIHPPLGDWPLSSTTVFRSPQVVKWVEKAERTPRRENLGRDAYLGTGGRKMPQYREFGVLQNRGVRRGQSQQHPAGGGDRGCPILSKGDPMRGQQSRTTEAATLP